MKPEGDSRPTDSAQAPPKSEQPTRERTQPASALESILQFAARFKAVPKRRLRILIVDDEEPVRKFVERVMSEAGHDTASASDGAEALAAAEKFEPIDVLVTDVMMPQMAGDELARRFRQKEPGLKVLYLTGFSDRLFKEKTTLWADEAFLDKPCSVKGLLQAVSLLVSGRLD